MSRPVRTVVILGVIALIGVVALQLLAGRYRKALPSAAPAAPVAAEAASVDEGELRHVDAFLAARKAMRAKMMERKPAMDALKLEYDQDFEKLKRSKMHLDVFFEILLERRTAVAAKGSTDEDYARVLKAFVARRDGKPVEDPRLATALDARRAELAEASFGDYAFWDDVEAAALR